MAADEDTERDITERDVSHVVHVIHASNDKARKLQPHLRRCDATAHRD